MNSRLELGDLQGLVVRGYRMSYARFSYYRFVDPAQARTWLGALADPVTTAEEWPKETTSALNVALSYPGLVALGLDETTLAGFPSDFVEGMVARGPDQLGDVGPNAPQHWEPPFRDRAVHAVLMVWAHNKDALQARFAEADRLRPPSVKPVGEQLAEALPEGREHFGYRDGISPSPAIAGDQEPRPGQTGPVQPGEFILGHPDEIGKIAGAELRAELGRNGTYVVYRKLYQDVAAFRAFLHRHGPNVGGQERLAAKLVGRWRSGAPLVLSPDADDPTLASDETRNNDFDYARDPHGLACPLGAHIRRAHPRSNESGRYRHLLMRRGLPYGPPLPEGASDDGQDRGLIGIFAGASIQRQFEFVQRAWLLDPSFDRLANESDPLAGPGGAFTIPGPFLPYPITDMPRLVTVRGGEYLFLPSISALTWLASLEGHRRSASSSRLLTPSFA